MQHTFSRWAVFAGIAGSLLTFASCGKEAKLTPPLIPDAYQLPQGDQPADDSILAFRDKYGTYILYKFTYLDFAYAAGYTINDTALQGDPQYVAPTLAFFKEECLSFYPEAFTRKTLPFRIIFSSEITNRDMLFRIVPGFGFSQSPEMMAIGWTNPNLATLTPAEKKKVRAKMHRSYMHRSISAGTLQIPDDFAALYPSFTGLTEANKLEKGLLEYPPNNLKDLVRDFVSYIDAITGQTTAELEAGILRPQADKKGLVRKKYNIVLRYFQQYGVDLASIGNRP